MIFFAKIDSMYRETLYWDILPPCIYTHVIMAVRKDDFYDPSVAILYSGLFDKLEVLSELVPIISYFSS